MCLGGRYFLRGYTGGGHLHTEGGCCTQSHRGIGLWLMLGQKGGGYRRIPGVEPSKLTVGFGGCLDPPKAKSGWESGCRGMVKKASLRSRTVK